MHVRVFEAKDMTTGLKMVKEALGPEALILSTRTVRTGRLGVLGKPMLEITAAIDTRWPESGDRLAGDRRTRPLAPAESRRETTGPPKSWNSCRRRSSGTGRARRRRTCIPSAL